jgi:hypothetical protein
VNKASGSVLQVGHDLRACTEEIQASQPFDVASRNVILIDTPGFDDTVKSETEILQLIADFLCLTSVSENDRN